MALVRPMALCLCKARTHALTHMQRRTNSVRCLQRAAILDCCHPGPGDVGARRVELRVHFTVSRRRRSSVLATAVPGACLGSVLRREGQREGRGPDARAPGARNPRSPSVRRGAAAPVCSCPSPWPPGAGAHVTVARALHGGVCALLCAVRCACEPPPNAPHRCRRYLVLAGHGQCAGEPSQQRQRAVAHARSVERSSGSRTLNTDFFF